MKNISSLKITGRLIGIVYLGLPLVVVLLILNWFFKITPYQKLQGMPLLIAPLTSLTGFILSYMVLNKSPNNLAKLGMAVNAIVFVLPFLYWFGGTLIFGL